MPTFQLDHRTILFVYTLVKVTQAIAIMLAWDTHRNYPPFKYWAFGSLFTAAGILLVAGRDIIPLWASVIAANGFIIPGSIIFNFGFIKAAGHRIPLRTGILVTIAALISISWYSLVTPDYVARLITFNLSVIFFDGYTAYLCFKYSRSGKSVTFKIAGFFILLTMISTLWRTASGINLNLSSILSPTLAQTQFYLVLIFFSVIITTLLVLLAAQNLQDKINVITQKLIRQSEVERDYAQINATTDGLTRLANRRRFDEILHSEFYRLKRSGAPLSLIMIDVDYFKNFNDTYGHITGDDCLRQIAQTIKKVVRRTYDTTARYGGEEFAVILPETDSSTAAVLAESMRKAIEDERLPHKTSKVSEYVTVSIGIVTVSTMRIAIPEKVVELADKALYRAKHNGRNRVESANDDTELHCNNKSDIDLIQLVWQASYESGNLTIDKEHKKLFENSNKLLSSIIRGSSRNDCVVLFDNLLEDIVTHFHNEEEILIGSDFPEYKDHSILHSNLVTSAAKIADKYHREELSSGELFSFLAYDVVAQHMFIEDKKFFPYIQKETV